MEIEMISKAPYMNKAEEYMKKHDFVSGDVHPAGHDLTSWAAI